ncbi:MAG: ATP-binding protein [Spirulinaceae cyanobacterium]
MTVLKKTLTTFSTDLKLLDNVLSWFDPFKPSSVSLKYWLECKLALAEGFTNAVRHAHRGLPTDELIEIEVTLYNDHLEMRIWDCGPPFDLTAHLNNLLEKKDNQWAGGGRGLEILQKISDCLSYTRIDDSRNCLLIGKNYDWVQAD